jgi:hypothetical protein
VSQDDRYVLKFFKQKAFILPEGIWTHWRREKKRRKKEKHRDRTFSAFKLSFDHLSEETGLLYVHLNPTDHLKRILHVTDTSGIVHALDSDTLQFVLQKKGTVAHEAIDQLMATGDLDGAKAAVATLVHLQVSLYQKGFRNRDPNLKSNCAFIGPIPEMIQESAPGVRQSPGIEIGGGGDSIKLNTIPSPANSIAGAFTRPRCRFLNHFRYKPLLIDVGRMVYCEEIREEKYFKKELVRITRNFRNYLAESHPELLAHFALCMTQILEGEFS